MPDPRTKSPDPGIVWAERSQHLWPMARPRHPGSTTPLAVALGAQGQACENEVELGRLLNAEIQGGEPVGVLERIYGQGRVKVLRALPGLPAVLQELVRTGRLKATAAVLIARHITDPQRLTCKLPRTSAK